MPDDLIGTLLGPYQVTAKLGEGGMGEVYRATDSRLKREVAIKVLPAAFTEDKERLARFEREAQLLAQLHHPNIASIFGLEESGGVKALVMELVPGPTLAERLESGPLSLTESLSFALQIAQALEEAHEKGVVHRDLKPQNIKASSEGRAKVLDFGLAKAMDPSGVSAASAADLARSPTLMHSPTLTAVHGTQLGMILGTAAYMAPEQARGAAVDKRADIWAFGVLLYEMLTGERLFDGDSVVDTLGAVMRKEIDLGRLPAGTPASIRQLLRRCLERNPKNRLHDIADARIVLDEVLSGRSEETTGAGAVLAAPAGGRRAAWLPWLAGFTLAAAAVAIAAFALRGRAPVARPDLLRFAISSASGAMISPGAGNAAISPDGRRVAFVGSDADGRRGLWIQELDQVRARLLAGTEGANYPFWAPDSRRVGYFDQAKLRKVSIDNGQIELISDAIEGRGGSWSRNGTIVFAPTVSGALAAVSENGGAPRPATRIENPQEEISHRFPSFLPDGERFVYISDPGADIEEGRVYLASLDGGERRLLYRSRRAPVYAAPGYLIDALGDRLVARPFDPKAGTLAGEPRRLEEPTPTFVNTQDRAASVSESGTLLVAAAGTERTKVVWLDRRGRPLGEIPLPRGAFASPRLSPDGGRLALVGGDSGQQKEVDLWVVELASERANRLTFSAGSETYPVWSPDGSRLAFQSNRSGVNDIWVRPSVAGGDERVLYASPTAWKEARSWVGDTLAFVTTERDTGFDTWLMHPDRPEVPGVRLLGSPASEFDVSISPDGRWLAYASNESGRHQVYVLELPAARTKYQVTTEGGRHPIWTRKGSELFYLTAENSVAVVPVAAGAALAFGAPVTLFPLPRLGRGSGADEVLFDVAADGSRIVLVEPEGESSETLTVVTHWLAELDAGEDRR